MSVPGIPREPPRDALLHDAGNNVWAFLEHEDRWCRLTGASPAPLRAWPELLAIHGPVDVLVWRGRITAPKHADVWG